jgi:hypothetical protein
MDHRRAGAGRADDRLRVARFKHLDELFRHSPRFVAITGIERRLPAARLTIVELNFTTRAAEHFDAARPDAAPHLVYQARNKQRDLHSIVDCRLSISGCHPRLLKSAIVNRQSAI